MKTVRISMFTAVVLFACAAGWLGASSQAQVSAPDSPVTKWEYKIVSGTDLEMVVHPRIKSVEQINDAEAKVLNDLGKDGWELAAVPSNSDGNVFRLYLKRPVPPQK